MGTMTVQDEDVAIMLQPKVRGVEYKTIERRTKRRQHIRLTYTIGTLSNTK